MGVLFICLKRIKLRVLIKRVSFYGVRKCAFVIDIEEGGFEIRDIVTYINLCRV